MSDGTIEKAHFFMKKSMKMYLGGFMKMENIVQKQRKGGKILPIFASISDAKIL